MDILLKQWHAKAYNGVKGKFINCIIAVLVIIYLSIICTATLEIFPFFN